MGKKFIENRVANQMDYFEKFLFDSAENSVGKVYKEWIDKYPDRPALKKLYDLIMKSADQVKKNLQDDIAEKKDQPGEKTVEQYARLIYLCYLMKTSVDE